MDALKPSNKRAKTEAAKTDGAKKCEHHKSCLSCIVQCHNCLSAEQGRLPKAAVVAICAIAQSGLTCPRACFRREFAWAAGTGYGHGHRSGGSVEVWDARASAAAQAAHDAELQVQHIS